MEYDRSLFGEGPYPITGPLTVLARAGFLVVIVAIVVTSFLPPGLATNFVRSYYLQHFAAFYVAGLLGLAASPRTRARNVAAGLFLFSSVLETSHLLSGAQWEPLLDNWVADLGGLAAACAPMWVARFRRRLERPHAD